MSLSAKRSYRNHPAENSKSVYRNQNSPKRTPFFSSEHSFFRPQHFGIQPKLTVNAPNDIYEKEADAMADRVMRMPDSQVQMQPKEEKEKMLQMQPAEEEEEKLQMTPEVPRIQQMCPRCQERAIQGKPLNCSECENKLQRKPAIQKRDKGQNDAPPQVINQLNASKGRGSALNTDIQLEMSKKMGADFSSVKVHTDSKAIQMNRQLGAKAFTHGSDIYFNQGKYNPASDSGKRLLAHELTHVVQQNQFGAFQESPMHSFQQTLLQRETEELTSYTPSSSGGGRPVRNRCVAGLGCPAITYCDNRPCAVVDCGTGSCPYCPEGFENLVIRAWCVYSCLGHGSAFILITNPFEIHIGPICL